VWARRRALPSQRRRALGAATDRSDAHRRHRPSRAPRRPGDPPAPLSLPHARDTTHHQGIPITTVHRTLLDLAATARPSELERALAQSERLRLYDHRATTDVIARNNGHKGTQILAQATSRKPKWTRNEWEAEFLGLIRQAGLPEPETNDAFHVPDYGRCEPDFHWPEQRVIVETDGFETHGTRAAFHADRAKDAALTAAGYRVLRFTRDDAPALAIRRLQAVLPTAGSRPRSG